MSFTKLFQFFVSGTIVHCGQIGCAKQLFAFSNSSLPFGSGSGIPTIGLAQPCCILNPTMELSISIPSSTVYYVQIFPTIAQILFYFINRHAYY
jgi:hypothetical protein